MEENTEKQTIFMEIFESFKAIVNNQTICQEINSGTFKQGLVDAVFLKSSEIMMKFKNLVAKDLFERSKSALVTATTQIDRSIQKEVDFMTMDRSLPLGRIIALTMTHLVANLKKDTNFLKDIDLTENFARPLVMKNGNYFIGFFYENLVDLSKKNVCPRLPKYGMLFSPKSNG